MAELLGQTTLLGFGVALTWLVLFHLLVNIWLLCVFTSLLVVLGGWLGSQAVLESNSVVHLERFVTLEQVTPSVEEEHDLDEEIRNTVKKIIRDFVSSWYSTVSSERSFEAEVQDAMISMGMELKRRAKQVDRKVLTQRILNLLGCHLQDYLRAKELVAAQRRPPAARRRGEQLWRAYSGVTPPHPATTGGAVEANYTRAVVDMLMHVLVPSPHLETRTGRFVVAELITCNVLLPLFAKLSDPDWLNLLVIGMFSRGAESQETVATAETPTSSRPTPALEVDCASQAEMSCAPRQAPDVPPPGAQTESASCVETVAPEAAAAGDGTGSEEVVCQLSHTDKEEATRPFLRHFVRGRKSNPFYQENDSDLDSPLADEKQSSTDSLVMIGPEDGLYDRQRDCAASDMEDFSPGPSNGSCPQVLVNSEVAEHSNDCGPSLEGTPVSNLQLDGSSPAANTYRELLLDPSGSTNELTIVSPLQGSSPLPSFSFEPLSSPDGPVIIQNLRITGTITAKEHRGTGSHPYTLYTIKYETAMAYETAGSIQAASEDAEALQTGFESPSPIQPVAYHMVNRRYSEFLNLQTRLEEKPELRKLTKGVKGPKKVFPDMPFGNMDSDKIEARKGLLETFLKQLCAIPEVANSEQMQEFLALNTDARIAFVKKPFIVSRIDKIVVNAIVDTLKTAFPRSEPQSPTEDVDGDMDAGKLTDKKSKSRLKFSSKNIPFMNGSDIRPPVMFSCEQTHTVFNGMSLEDLQTFVTEQEKLSQAPLEPEVGVSSAEQGCGGELPEDSGGKLSQEHAETALADVALNILCLLMKEQWSWLCTENVQRTVRLIFGTLIDRWLDVSVANLTSTGYWVMYLQVVQEAVWPGGALPTAPPTERSQQEKDSTRQRALGCLMKILPDVISDLLGGDKYKLSWQTALDSFQNADINRHLVYCICDLLLDSLVPEIPELDFQRSLLHDVSRNPEKLLA